MAPLKGSKDKKKRKTNPKSLANLRPRRPGVPGRTAGFLHFAGVVFAHMLDTRVNENGEPQLDENGKPDLRYKPYPVFVAEKMMEKVNKGGKTLDDFMGRLLPNIADLDRIITKQNSQDLKYLHYLIHRHCFDEQRQVLLSGKAVIDVICGRRAGKSTVFADLLVDRSIEKDKGVAIYLGRTAKSAFDIIWRPLLDILDYIAIPYTPHLATQSIELNSGSRIMVKGRDNKADIENIRGLPIYLAIVDETQGDPPEKLKMLVREVLEPAGRDFEGSQVVMGGTPSRIPGNYAEEVYQSNRADVARFNWNMSVNPHLPKNERDIEKTRVEKGFSGNDPTFLREYMGMVGSYDVEALVFRITDANRFRETSLTAWIDSQPITDIFFSGGIDYGFDDFNSAVIIMASESKPERFLLAEYKGHRQSTSDFGNELKRITALVVGNPILAKLPNKRFTWYCDTEGLGKQLTHDLASMYSVSVQPAYQGQADLMVEMLQDDVKQGRFKVHEKQKVGDVEVVGEFEKETYKIVFARDEQDHLTRRIDDEVFHPEITKSALYAMRYVWLKSKIKPATVQK